MRERIPATVPVALGLRCSFCGKSESDCATMIEALPVLVPLTVRMELNGARHDLGSAATVEVTPIICDDCVATCLDVIAHHKQNSGAAATTPPETKE
jgi:hypothetical protein